MPDPDPIQDILEDLRQLLKIQMKLILDITRELSLLNIMMRAQNDCVKACSKRAAQEDCDD